MAKESEITDELLLNRFRRGNSSAFEQLYTRYRKSLYIYLLRTCANSSEADDLYQEVWSRVIDSKERFNHGSFKAYIFRIARNLQIDHFRRQSLRLVTDGKSSDEVIDPQPEPDDRSHAEDCGKRLLSELSLLPNDQRDAFLLKEESGLSLQQIAEMAHTGRETIKSRLRYALKRLRSVLEDCL